MPKGMSALQKKRVDLITEKVLDLNLFEMRYLTIMMKENLTKNSGFSPFYVNQDWPSKKSDSVGIWPPANPNWFK